MQAKVAAARRAMLRLGHTLGPTTRAALSPLAVVRCLHCHQAVLVTPEAVMHAALPCLGKLQAAAPLHAQVHQALVARGRV